MNHTNLNDAWAMFHEYKQQSNTVPKNNIPNTPRINIGIIQAPNNGKNSPLSNRENDPLETMFGQHTWSNHSSIVTSQEDYKVGKFVKDVYFTMFPEKNGEMYPAHWILPVMDSYKKIRELRAKQLKTKTKDAMKGLKMNIVTGCILRCELINSGLHIPLPILLQFMNLAISKSRNKRDRKLIKLELFETYRLDSKKGIKTHLKNVIPMCYNELNPEDLIEYTANGILRFNRADTLKAKRIARHAWNDGDGDFPDTTSPSLIAIAALLAVCVLTDNKFDYKFFGLSQIVLINAYKVIINSENEKVQKELNAAMLSPNTAVYGHKVSSVKK